MARLPLLFILFALLPWHAAAEGDPPAYRIIRPTDQAHDLLPKTCRVCHKEEAYRFFVVAAPDQKSLDLAAEMLAGRGAAPGEANRKPANPHAAIACLFCHLEPSEKGMPADGMSFRTLEGTPAARTEVKRLCELCHPGGAESHPRVIAGERAGDDLAKAGLPVPEGRILCTTCHELHEKEAGPGDVRLGYLDFAVRSPESHVHGNRAACRACHPVDLAPGSEAVFLDADPTALCVGCHPADHGGIHPMGVKSTEKTYPMDFLGYPVDGEGRLSCSTCHDHPCVGRLDPKNPSFLRGGPYLVSTEFCYRCHPKAGTGALNPHQQVDVKGRVITTTCAYCHRRIPDQENPEEAYFGPEDLTYLSSPVELCMGCHDPGPHPTGINHLVEMGEERIEKLNRYQQRHGVKLPLDGKGRIVCTTCHNPHAKGVLRGRAALGAGELNQWRVPSYAELCTPCHARYD